MGGNDGAQPPGARVATSQRRPGRTAAAARGRCRRRTPAWLRACISAHLTGESLSLRQACGDATESGRSRPRRPGRRPPDVTTAALPSRTWKLSSNEVDVRGYRPAGFELADREAGVDGAGRLADDRPPPVAGGRGRSRTARISRPPPPGERGDVRSRALLLFRRLCRGRDEMVSGRLDEPAQARRPPAADRRLRTTVHDHRLDVRRRHTAPRPRPGR